MTPETQKEVYAWLERNKMQPVNEPISGPPHRGYSRFKFEIMAAAVLFSWRPISFP